MSKIIFAKTKEKMHKRLAALQEILVKEGVDAYLIEDPIELAYFTGQSFSMGRLWVTKKHAALFVDARYIEAAKKGSFIQPVILLTRDAEKEFITKARPSIWGCDATRLPYSRVEMLKGMLLDIGGGFVSKEGLSTSLRMVKSDDEIKKMKKSSALLTKVYTALLSKIRVGMKEKDVATCFEILLREMGAEASAFDPIVAFGANSAMPHYRAGGAVLKKDQMILLDLGLVLDGYHSDMTRVIFHGRPDPFLLKLCSVVRNAHKAAVALSRKGACVGDLDRAARAVMKKEGLEEYFTHSLGHGIGLETHESPRIRYDGADKDLILEPGMVITIEPGLYIPGKGGVRWEDMILITEKGPINMTKAV
jgi:Xaa-Pro aminopeptidase